MLDEHRLDNGVAGWLELPWRSGWNAASFAYTSYERFAHDDNGLIDFDVRALLGRWVLNQYVAPSIYETADGIIAEVSIKTLHHNLKAARLLIAGFRCVQLTIANSSGGGVTYNDVLRTLFDRLPDHWPAMLKDEMRTARCMDAIGTHPTLMNDSNDKLRRAFCIAWDRGLYRAAYALKGIS